MASGAIDTKNATDAAAAAVVSTAKVNSAATSAATTSAASTSAATTSAIALAKRAHDAYKKTDYKTSMDLYRSAVAADPNNSDIGKWMCYSGLAALKAKLFDLAIDMLAVAINDGNYDPSLCYQSRGVAYQELGRLQDALTDYNKSIQLKFTTAENEAIVRNNRATIYCALKQYDLAIKDYDRAIQLNPAAKYKVYYNRGNVKLELDRLEDAAADFTRVIELDPHPADGYFKRGFVRDIQGRFAEADADLNRGIELSPNHAGGYYTRGCVRMKHKQWLKAKQDLEKALALSTSSNILDICRKTLADLDIRQSEDAKARQEADKNADKNADLFKSSEASAASPAPAPTVPANKTKALDLVSRADNSLQRRDFETGITEYLSAAELDPQNPRSLRWRWNAGVAALDGKMFSEAVGIFTALINNGTFNLRSCYRCRGAAFYELKQLDEAANDFTKAIELAPNGADEYGYWKRSGVRYLQKRVDEAIADLNRVIELSPNHADAYYSRGRVKFKQRKLDGVKQDLLRAQQLWIKFPDQQPPADSLDACQKILHHMELLESKDFNSKGSTLKRKDLQTEHQESSKRLKMTASSSTAKPTTLSWKTPEVVEWVKSLGAPFEQYIAAFKTKCIDGPTLLTLTPALLSALGVTDELHRAKFIANIDVLQKKEKKGIETATAASPVTPLPAAATACAASSSSAAYTTPLPYSNDDLVSDLLAENAKLKETATALENEKLCCICLDHPKDIRFAPCGHAICCSACANAQRRCPTCRVRITARQKLFQ